jgi:hypothetical protein
MLLSVDNILAHYQAERFGHMSDSDLTVRGYSLTQSTIEIIERVSRDRKLFNSSAALRQIVDEWNDYDAERFKLTEAGRQALAEARRRKANDNHN